MTDRSDTPNTSGTTNQPAKPRTLTDTPGFIDGIPVEELVRLTREFTARITNEDRQRVQLELNESARAIQTGTPFLLQQFFSGRVDLDAELSHRFPGAPLLASATFTPEPGKRARHGTAQFVSQDNAASMRIELHGTDGQLEASFTLNGMIGVNFRLGAIPAIQRKRFLDLMRRSNGIAFLWTIERWERDYLVFVVRERFARVYAFGPGRFDAACRLTPDGLEQLLTWLSTFWPTDGTVLPPEIPPLKPETEDSPSSALTW